MSVTFFRLRHYTTFQSSELGMSDTGDDWMRPCCGDTQSALALRGQFASARRRAAAQETHWPK